jgi:hypothetical protein
LCFLKILACHTVQLEQNELLHLVGVAKSAIKGNLSVEPDHLSQLKTMKYE